MVSIHISLEFYKWFYRVNNIHIELTNGKFITEGEDIDVNWGLMPEEKEEVESYCRNYLESKGYDVEGITFETEVDEYIEDD